MTHTEKTHALHNLAAQIAALLGEGWSYTDTSGDQWATIAHADGRALSLSHVGGWGKKPLRLAVSGSYPSYQDEQGRSQRVMPPDLYNPKEEYPEITVSLEKTAEAMAKDIQRRFLPEYSRIWERCQELKQSRAEYADAKRRAHAELAAIAGVHFCGQDRGEVNLQGWVKIAGNSHRSADIRINSADSIEVKAGGLTVDQARAVIELIQTFAPSN